MKNMLLLFLCLILSVFITQNRAYSQTWSRIRLNEIRTGETNAAAGFGRINCIRFHPDYDGSGNKIMYAGTYLAGLWMSEDHGNDWTPVTPMDMPVMSVADVAFDPDDADIMYLATGDPDLLLDKNIPCVKNEFAQSRGIFKSTDGGLIWNTTPLGEDEWDALSGSGKDASFWEFPSQKMMGEMLVNPLDGDIMYACLYHLEFGSGAVYNSYIYKTTDGGAHWSRIKTFNDEIVRNLEFKPGNPSVIYAAGKTVYRSTDSGASWTDLAGNGLIPTTSNPVLRCVVGVTPADTNYLYILMAEDNAYPGSGETAHNIYISANGGNTVNYVEQFDMKSQTSDGIDNPLGRYVIAVDPTDESVLYCGSGVIYKVGNYGASWSLASTWRSNYNTSTHVHADVHSLEFSPSGILFAGTDGGVYKATFSLGNVTWSDVSDSLDIAHFYGVSGSSDNKNIIMAGSQDVGTVLYDKVNVASPGWGWIAGGDGGTCVIDYSNALDINDNNNYHYNNDYFNHKLNRFNTYFGSENSIKPLPVNTYSFRNFLMNPVRPKTIYHGLREVYKHTNRGGSSWTKISDFAGMGAADKELVALAVNPLDTNTIYAAYIGLTYNDADVDLQVFKTVDGGGNWYDLRDKSPSLASPLAWKELTDIAINPDDTGEVCISFTGCPDGGVYCSTNGGHDWSNAAAVGGNSLPYSVNSLEYQKGRDQLFAASDFGVYLRTEYGGEWQLYGSGLPNILVHDLDIDYCKSVIKVATRGRGIWEAPIADGNIDMEITTNTVWGDETFRIIPHNVVIKPGVKLTINGAVGMLSGGKIVVERGAQLWVNGGRITSACSNKMWRGIEVWGTSSADQYPVMNNPDQGLVNLINGAVIENARDGITVIKKNANGSIDWGGYTGGIVIGRDATFKNCCRAVEFWPYQNKKAGKNVGNASYFQDCEFVTDADLNDENTDPLAFVTIWETDGIRFWNCKFRNLNTNAVAGKHGTGIGTIDARFFVLPDPTSLSDRCYFENLDYGVYAQSLNPMKSASLVDADFVDNARSVYLKGMELAEVSNCTFDIGPRVNGAAPYGLYLDNCNFFLVEGNTFDTQLSEQAPYGIICDNTAFSPNEIYRNDFQHMRMNVVLRKTNRYMSVLCNTFDYTSRDDIHIAEDGIAIPQGFCDGVLNMPAGNVFSANGISNEHIHVESFGNSFTYHHGSGADETPTKLPASYIYVTLNDCESESSCPVRTFPGLVVDIAGFDGEHSGEMEPLRIGKNETEDPEKKAYYNAQYYRKFNEVSRMYWNMADTILDTIIIWNSNPDSLIAFLEAEELEDGVVNPLLILAYLEAGDATSADSKLDDYEYQQPVSESAYIKFLRLLVYMEANNIETHSINNYVDSLGIIIVNDSTKRGSGNAEVIFTINDSIQYPELIEPLCEEEGGRLAPPAPLIPESDQQELVFRAIPNPFRDATELYINLPERYEQATLTIVGIRGDLVKEIRVKKGENRISLNSSEVKPGIYFCTLNAGGLQLEVLRVEHVH